MIKVSEMQSKFAKWSTEDTSRKFFDIYNLIANEEWLLEAFNKVKLNKGSKTAGIDGYVRADFEKNLSERLSDLVQELRDETFKPDPVRRVAIPKATGKIRYLGIPTLKDRIVQMAIKMAIEPIWESDFLPMSHGFRPQRTTHMAIRHVALGCQDKGGGSGYRWLIEGDIKSYFDTVHHKHLMTLLRQRINDKRLLNLIWKFLKAGIMERKLFLKTDEGVPQGGVLSPLLANIYLHEFDKWMYDNYCSRPSQDRARYYDTPRVSYVRYADDFIVMIKGNKHNVTKIRENIREYLEKSLMLTLNIDKSNITHINDGIEFLGYRIIRKRQSSGEMATVLTIPKRAIKRVCDKLNTRKEDHSSSIKTKIMARNAIVRGWCNYYRHATSVGDIFGKIDTINFWDMSHWLCRKFKTSMPETLRKYYKRYTNRELRVIGKKTIMDGNLALIHGGWIKRINYARPVPRENVFILGTDTMFGYDEDYVKSLTIKEYWSGSENMRTGQFDLKQVILDRDGMKCSNPLCKSNNLQLGTMSFAKFRLQLHHIKPVSEFKNIEDANRLENLTLLCPKCHWNRTQQQVSKS